MIGFSSHAPGRRWYRSRTYLRHARGVNPEVGEEGLIEAPDARVVDRVLSLARRWLSAKRLPTSRLGRDTRIVPPSITLPRSWRYAACIGVGRGGVPQRSSGPRTTRRNLVILWVVCPRTLERTGCDSVPSGGRVRAVGQGMWGHGPRPRGSGSAGRPACLRGAGHRRLSSVVPRGPRGVGGPRPRRGRHPAGTPRHLAQGAPVARSGEV